MQNQKDFNSSIRNFSIIAHIDHGKTTLTDTFLRLTNSVDDQNHTERIMDSNPIEQERGITIKLAPARMNYVSKKHGNKEFILNLIDTPGHVDFGYEVSRSLHLLL
jgi:GTP-binding protein LepA